MSSPCQVCTEESPWRGSIWRRHFYTFTCDKQWVFKDRRTQSLWQLYAEPGGGGGGKEVPTFQKAGTRVSRNAAPRLLALGAAGETQRPGSWWMQRGLTSGQAAPSGFTTSGADAFDSTAEMVALIFGYGERTWSEYMQRFHGQPRFAENLAPPLESHGKAGNLPNGNTERSTDLPSCRGKLLAHLSASDPIRLDLNHFKADPTTTLMSFPLLFQIQLLKGKTRET